MAEGLFLVGLSAGVQAVSLRWWAHLKHDTVEGK